MASRLRCSRLDTSSGGAAAVTRPGCRPFSGPGQGSGPAAPGVVGGRRRPPASRRGLGTGRAGGPLAAVEGVVQAGALVREVYVSIREMYERLGRKSWAQRGRREAGEGRRRGRGGAGTGRAGSLLAAVERVAQAGTLHERWTRDSERCTRDWAGNLGRNTADSAAGEGRAWWRHTDSAGGLFAVVEGGDRQERMYERYTRVP